MLFATKHAQQPPALPPKVGQTVLTAAVSLHISLYRVNQELGKQGLIHSLAWSDGVNVEKEKKQKNEEEEEEEQQQQQQEE